MNRHVSIRCLLVLGLGWLAAIAIGRPALAADPMSPQAVPEPLRPWVPWALDGADDARCPPFFERAGVSLCAWPTRLELSLDDRGGAFAQSWHGDGRRWVPLPGSDERWPLDVKIDGVRTAVTLQSGAPSVLLAAGEHVVTGSFRWDSLPDSLPIPPGTGLLALEIHGAPIERPNRDPPGVLWLLGRESARGEGDSLDIVVDRKLSDGVPLVLTTRIELRVAGKSREALLGRPLAAGFVPMSLRSDLPVQLEPDGRLRAQLRPGIAAVTLTARSVGDERRLARPDPQGPWSSGDEVWVFEANGDLRVVAVEGPPSIDPRQTTLPEEWRRFPAYLMKRGTVLTLDERHRANADPPPDRLSIVRQLWLDFDGGGYSVSDRVSGTLGGASRLTMAPPTRLGRVSIDGVDQFITRFGDDGWSGVEVRPGQLDLVAESRIPSARSVLPALGWARDFHQAACVLHVPPGWRLVHAAGVDDVPGTWVSHWSLLELFLALVASMGLWRLYGRGWGVVALATFGLTLPEPGAPHWTWLLPIAAEALFRVVPATAAKALFDVLRTAAVLLVAILAVPFVIAHVREGLHPGLAHGGAAVDGVRGGGEDRGADERPAGAVVGAGAPDVLSASADSRPPNPADRPGDANGPGAAAGARSAPAGRSPSIEHPPTYDLAAVVQTGPGVPRWKGRAFDLRWSGPVASTQRVHLFLLPPSMNLILALLRAALLALLVGRLLPRGRRRLPWGRWAAAAIAFLPARAWADVPSPDLLKELAVRLERPPSCAPECASSGRMAIDVRESSLAARIEVDAAASTAVPLPGRFSEWRPAHVMLDGRPAGALARTADGLLWIELPAGIHQIAVDGPLPDAPSVSVALPMKSHHVRVSSSGWKVSGVREDGWADGDLQLARDRAPARHAEAASEAAALPAFLRVERTLHVGIDWSVDTRVERVTPPGSSISVEIPLLAGERVTTEGVRIDGGSAVVEMGSEINRVTWHSVLAPSSPLRLTAPRSLAWAEVWRLDAAPMWHASFTGIPSVRPRSASGSEAADAGGELPEWLPWPGESLSIDLERPRGVPGQTLTIDASAVDVRPGLRATDVTLALWLRASRGTEYVVTLPPAAQLESVSIDDVPQPIRQQAATVTVPVAPGARKIALSWRESAVLPALFRSPRVDLGLPSVNATTTLEVPRTRWLLFVGGPGVGPAVLFWSLLLVLIPVSFALGASRWTPLRGWHWLLLAIGLSQIHVAAAIVLVGWLLTLGWRSRVRGGAALAPELYNARQIGLVVWTAVALAVLAASLLQGLLDAPEMQVAGNGSTAAQLRWFTDRAAAALPRPWMFSVPLFVYRGAMLAWALWIALALLGWLRWGWAAFSAEGIWRVRAAGAEAPDPADSPVAGAAGSVPVSTPPGAPPPS